MLSYQHTYHAGNHADILKQTMLSALIAGMQHKEGGLFLFDTFASRGNYDLTSTEALKNREFATGVEPLWSHRNDGELPESIQRWFTLLAEHNRGDEVQQFPGSTALMASMLRPQDRLAACDLHPQEFAALRRHFRQHRRVALHQRDAYEALKALLPPKEKRGLVFLDPSYEDKSEYRKIMQAVEAVYPHFRQGVYVIWYPILPAAREKQLLAEVRMSGIKNVLNIELHCGDHFPEMQMAGSGLLVINPPWHAQKEMEIALAWISKHLVARSGRSCFEWLS